jgi:hypothetical protein
MLPTGHPAHKKQVKSRLVVSMLSSDLDFWGHVTLACASTLGILALITMVLALGVVALYSWEAEWFLRSSSSAFSSGLFS